MLHDPLIFYDKLCAVASLSVCKDKHVGAIAIKHGMPVACAFNVKDPKCNGKCSEHKCAPIHAEHELNAPAGSIVLLTLYPCEQCQRRLYQMGVKEILVVGHPKKHKEDLGLIPITLIEV